MAKKKKKTPQKPDAAAAPLPLSGVSSMTSRRSAAICIGALCVLWLIQFFGVLSGSANLWEDVVELEYPFRMFIRSALLGGEFPHWNPFTFGGMPFFATGTGMLYPLNALLLLPLSDKAMWWLMQMIIVSHILIAGICMFFYLRFKERTDSAALFGAIAFMFGGYMITHVIHSTIIYIVAWMPLMLILLERGVSEVKPRFAVMGGLLLGAVMQVGHPQVMLYAIVFMLTYGVYFITKSGRPHRAAPTAIHGGRDDACPPTMQTKPLLLKRSIIAITLFAIAAGLCLVQYLPTFEASGHTARINFTINQASEGSLQFVQLLTALLPKVFGAYTGEAGVPGFWLEDAFSRGAHNYWESCFYFGVSTLILSVFLFRRIRTDGSAMMAAGWILLSLLIALGGNFFFYKILFSLGIPGFNSFRHTPRILFIWGFLFPVMAAAALDALDDFKSSKRLRTVSLTLCAAALVLGIITAAGGLTAVFPPMNTGEGRAQYASHQGIILLVNALFFGMVLIPFFTNKIKINTAKGLIIACLAIDMLLFAAGQHITTREGTNAAAAYKNPDAEAIRNMRKNENEIFRVNTRQFLVQQDSVLGRQNNPHWMKRNQGYVSGIEMMEGYNQFRLKYASLPLRGENFYRMLDLMNVKLYIDPNSKEGNVLTNSTRLPRAKLFYKAKVIDGGKLDLFGSADSLIAAYMNSEQYDHRNEVVVTNKDFAKFTGGGGAGKAQITKYANNRIEIDVDTDREAILWLSEIWYPAWKATVNGNKVDIHRANYSFRAIVVPAGQSKVVFRFQSTAFNVGALISLLTLIGALGYLLAERVIKKKTPVNA